MIFWYLLHCFLLYSVEALESGVLIKQWMTSFKDFWTMSITWNVGLWNIFLTWWMLWLQWSVAAGECKILLLKRLGDYFQVWMKMDLCVDVCWIHAALRLVTEDKPFNFQYGKIHKNASWPFKSNLEIESCATNQCHTIQYGCSMTIVLC